MGGGRVCSPASISSYWVSTLSGPVTSALHCNDLLVQHRYRGMPPTNLIKQGKQSSGLCRQFYQRDNHESRRFTYFFVRMDKECSYTKLKSVAFPTKFFPSLHLGAEYNPSFPYGNGENGVMTHQILLEEKQCDRSMYISTMPSM
jgi:hypothetical protein